MTFLTAQALIILWMIGFSGSFIIQTIFQRWFAKNSYWGANKGWQNEIAIWNLGVIIMLAGLLRSNFNVESYVLPGLAVLSTCFGINHAVALTHSSASISNWAGAIMNALGVVAYGLFVIFA